MTFSFFIGFLSELILSLSILYLLIYNSFLATSSRFNYPLLDRQANIQVIFLLVLILFILNSNYISIFGTAYLFFIDNSSTSIKIIIVLSTISVLVLSSSYFESSKINSFEYFIIYLLSVFSLFMLISSSDFITVYLGLEMLSLNLYILAAFRKFSAFSSEAGLKYFILGSIASGIILLGFVLIYGVSGITNFHELSLLFLNDSDYFLNNSLFNFALFFIIVGFFFKLGAAPFHIWLPDVYEGSPFSSTFFFSVVPKTAYLITLGKICFLPFLPFFYTIKPFFIITGILSVMIGSLEALKQNRVKRLLVFSSISHTGFILLSFSCGSVFGFSNALFYTFFYIINSCIIWGSILFLNKNQSSSLFLTDIAKGLFVNKTIIILLSLSLFSLAGIPPFSGFFIKFLIFLGVFNTNTLISSSLVLLLSIIGTFYYIRIPKIASFESKYSKTSLLIKDLTFMDQYSSKLLSIFLFLIAFFFIYANIFYLLFNKITLCCITF